MTIGAGIFLIAVGAILKFATNFHVQGVSIDTIGVILMIAGAAGLILGIFQELDLVPPTGRRQPRHPQWKNAAK